MDKQQQNTAANIIRIIIVLAILAMIVTFIVAKASNKKPAIDNGPTTVEILQVTSTDQVRGDRNAPITIVEYSDFQCPYCVKYYPALKQVVENYPGQVRWVSRNFPLSGHLAAKGASLAAMAAGEQGKYWEYADLLAANSQYDGTGLAEPDLTKYATSLGLQLIKFNTDRQSQTFENIIEKDVASGTALKIEGTPASYLIDKNGNVETIPGYLTYEQLKTKIDTKLAN